MTMNVRFLGALLGALLLSPALLGQYHEDETRGFKFKPPRDYRAVALNPTERVMVAKYQNDTMEYGGEQGTAGYSRVFEVRFYPAGDSEDEEESEDEVDPYEPAMDYLEGVFGYYDVDKEKKVKIGGIYGKEMHITPGHDTPVLVYAAIVAHDDGVWLFEGTAIDKRFKKAVSDFSKATKSFARIEKVDTSAHDAELAQMDKQDRFLQKQIDKLPPGWDHIRTERYLFLFNAEKNFVKEMSEQIEALRDEYERLYPPDEPLDAVSIVRVCNSRSEYSAYGGPPGSGGYWSPGHKELVFFDMAPRTETLCVLNHEAFHQFIYYFYGELSPHSWYNEGHGDYFSGADMTRTYRIKEYGSAPGGFNRSQFIKDMARAARSGKSVGEGAAAPLKELLNYSQQQYYSRGPVRPVAFYPQGWAVVHMLREAKGLQPKWKRILPDYLENLVAARHEVAEQVMKKEIENAEKIKKGSSEDMSTDVADYYGKVDTRKVQTLGYERTFSDWSDEDWAEFDDFFLSYCEKL